MKKSKKLCYGCYDNYYNGRERECWCYKDAKVCKKAFVHISMVPPWGIEPETTLSCHHRQKYVAVKPNHPQLTSDKNHIQKYDGKNY